MEALKKPLRKRSPLLFLIAGIFLILLYQKSFAVAIDGYCYLQNQTNHSGTEVRFQAVSPTAVTDSVFTDSTGYYYIEVSAGFYNIFYSHEGYFGYEIIAQNCYSPVTLTAITLTSIPVYPPISGALSGVLQSGQYLVQGDIYIEIGDSLIIEPGTILNFTGAYDFQINGYLYAVGNEVNGIGFVEDTTTILWGGIQFQAETNDSSRLEYCQIRNTNGDGLQIINCSPYIFYCSFYNCDFNGISTLQSQSTIESCHIYNNNSEGMQCFTGSQITILNSIFEGNNSHGIMCAAGSEAIIENCQIRQNGESGIYVTDATLEARYNIIDDNNHSGIRITEISSAILDSNTIQGNSAEYGAGIFCVGNAPIITNNIITGNMSSGFNPKGGAMYLLNCSQGTVLEGNSIIGNTMLILGSGAHTGMGGGIFCYGSDVEIIDNLISGNSITGCTAQGTYSLFGGGLYGENSDIVMTDNDFLSNTVFGARPAISYGYYNYGGGIYIFNSSVTMENNLFDGNSSLPGTECNFNDIIGGAVYTDFSLMIVSNNQFVQNIAEEGKGGGFYCSNLNSLSVIDSNSFSQNFAQYGGGIYCKNSGITINRNTIFNNTGEGIYCYQDSSFVSNCTISGNSNSGIYLHSSSVIVRNNIICNSASFGGVRFNQSYTSTIDYCDFFNNTGGNFYSPPYPAGLGVIVTVNANGDPCDCYHNIFLNPSLINPAVGNLNLMIGSPCIDAGNPLTILDPDSTIADIGAIFFDQTVPFTLLGLSSTNLIFPSTFCGLTEERTLTLYNLGNSNIIISQIITTDSIFTTDFSHDDSLIVPDDNLLITLFFTPDTIDTFYASLEIYYNNLDTSVALQGIGLGGNYNTVQGYCYLENQVNHSETIIAFSPLAGGTLGDTTYTNSTGHYTAYLSNGIYSVNYVHDGFVSEIITAQAVYSSLTLPQLTLIQIIPGIALGGTILGTLIDTSYIVQSQLIIPQYQQLTIQAGADFYFMGNFPLTVNGALNAIGEESDSIKFQPHPGIDGWGGLDFSNLSTNINQLEYCLIAGSLSSGIYSNGADLSIIHSTISDNSCSTSYGGAGLQLLGDGYLEMDYCKVNRNSVLGWNYGGGFYINWLSSNISHTEIALNTAVHAAGLVYDEGVHYLTNCTIYGNQNGAINVGLNAEAAQVFIVNDIFVNNTGPTINFDSNVNSTVRYCDFYGNTGELFIGENIPTFLGWAVTTNANGDSCDMYSNIFLNPLFIDTTAGDFHLTSASPCIDAGKPDSPLDPDSSISDIGAYYYDQTQGVAISTFDLLPFTFTLVSYPNPFNISTQIRFTLPYPSEVNIAIYDVLGREVSEVANNWYSAGDYTLQWDASAVTSGLYFVKMKAGAFRETNKVLLLK